MLFPETFSYHLRVPPNQQKFWCAVTVGARYGRMRLKRVWTSLKLQFPSTSHLHFS